MAGDWMKVSLDLPDKPEVAEIAEALGMPSDAVVGKLIRVWGWFDRHTTDGNARVTLDFLNDIADATGFAQAMCEVGWLSVAGKVASVPNFGRHNGTTGKARAVTSKRVKRFRNGDVTPETLPEKRREEKSITTSSKEEVVSPFADSPTVMTFETNGKPGTWELKQGQVDEWIPIYPSLQVVAECSKALAWTKAKQRKTAKGMPVFLVNWLNRATNQARAGPAQASPDERAAKETENRRIRLEALANAKHNH